MNPLSVLLRGLCADLLERHPDVRKRVILNRAGDGPYLERYYFAGGSTEEGGRGSPDFTVCLHRFCASDSDEAVHNHPWEHAVSLILAGGYSEQRRVPTTGELVTRTFRPGAVNLIGAEDFHRVDLLESECWSFFVAGKKTDRSWGFWSKRRGFQPWRDFIAEARGLDPRSVVDALFSEQIQAVES